MSTDYTISKDEIRSGRFELDGVVWVPERTCEPEGSIEWKWSGPTTYYEFELSCGHVITKEDSEPPNYCEECGAKVVKQ